LSGFNRPSLCLDNNGVAKASLAAFSTCFRGEVGASSSSVAEAADRREVGGEDGINSFCLFSSFSTLMFRMVDADVRGFRRLDMLAVVGT